MAVINVSRFPIFIYKGKIVNRNEVDPEFVKYVKTINSKSKSAALAIKTLYDEDKLSRRFFINNKIIHPSLNRVEELLNRVYVYPSLKYQYFDNHGAIVLALTLKLQRIYNIPLVLIQTLTEEEYHALELISMRKKDRSLNLRDILEILNSLIIVKEHTVLANSNIVLKVKDEVLNETYYLLINSEGKLLGSNVCYEPSEGTFVWEAVLNLRRHGFLHIYPPSSYPWIR